MRPSRRSLPTSRASSIRSTTSADCTPRSAIAACSSSRINTRSSGPNPLPDPVYPRGQSISKANSVLRAKFAVLGLLSFFGRMPPCPEALEGLREAVIEPSVGSLGGSCDNTLAGTIDGLYESAIIHRRGPHLSLDSAEKLRLAVLYAGATPPSARGGMLGGSSRGPCSFQTHRPTAQKAR